MMSEDTTPSQISENPIPPQQDSESYPQRCESILRENHSLKNKLTPIKLFFQLIETMIEDPGLMLPMAKMRYETLKDLEDTSKRIHAFASGTEVELEDEGIFEAVDIDKEVEDFISLLKLQSRGNITFTTDILYRGKLMTNRAVLFRTVMDNIVVNAIQACESRNIDEGLFVIELLPSSHYETRYGKLELFDTITAKDVFMVCRDNAGGLPKTLESQFFDFGFTHDKEGGTGIGTAEIRDCVQAKLDGQVALENHEGQGLAIHLRFSQDLTRSHGGAS